MGRRVVPVVRWLGEDQQSHRAIASVDSPSYDRQKSVPECLRGSPTSPKNLGTKSFVRALLQGSSQAGELP